MTREIVFLAISALKAGTHTFPLGILEMTKGSLFSRLPRRTGKRSRTLDVEVVRTQRLGPFRKVGRSTATASRATTRATTRTTGAKRRRRGRLSSGRRRRRNDSRKGNTRLRKNRRSRTTGEHATPFLPNLEEDIVGRDEVERQERNEKNARLIIAKKLPPYKNNTIETIDPPPTFLRQIEA